MICPSGSGGGLTGSIIGRTMVSLLIVVLSVILRSTAATYVALPTLVSFPFISVPATSFTPVGMFVGIVNNASQVPSAFALTVPGLVPASVPGFGESCTWTPSKLTKMLSASGV